MIRVLFVCAGNICRSPMAEAVFRDVVSKAGLADHFFIDSAGTGAWYAGEPAHEGTLKVLQKNRISYDGRARQFVQHDLNNFDYVLAMDRENLSVITRYLNRRDETARVSKFGADGQTPEIGLFLSYANRAGVVLKPQEVPDPFYSGRFDETYDLIVRGCAALLDYIRARHGL